MKRSSRRTQRWWIDAGQDRGSMYSYMYNRERGARGSSNYFQVLCTTSALFLKRAKVEDDIRVGTSSHGFL